MSISIINDLCQLRQNFSWTRSPVPIKEQSVTVTPFWTAEGENYFWILAAFSFSLVFFRQENDLSKLLWPKADNYIFNETYDERNEPQTMGSAGISLQELVNALGQT